MLTFQDAIATARSELGDTYEGNYSYSTEDMLRYAVEGVREAWGPRPSLRYDESTGLLYDPATALPASTNDLSFDLALPERYQSAISYYIIFRCLSRDVTDKGNAAAAASAKSRFDQIVMG